MSDIKFIDGLRVYKPSERAPDFVIANGAIDMQEFRQWWHEQGQPGKVRFVVKESREGRFYAAVDDFEPRRPDATRSAPAESQGGTVGFDSDPIPF